MPAKMTLAYFSKVKLSFITFVRTGARNDGENDRIIISVRIAPNFAGKI